MEWNRVICGDCEAIMKDLINEGVRFDLVLTDPPYNLKKDFGNDSDNLSLADFQVVNKRRLSLCYEILEQHGQIIWFAIHNNVGILQNIMSDVGFIYRRMNIWHYDNGFSRSTKTLATNYEPFLWYSKDKKFNFNADDIRVPYKSERVKNPIYYKGKNGERKIWTPNPLGAMHGDVWNYPTLSGKVFAKERTAHPTQKPEALIMDLIRAFCPKDQDGYYCGTILDPFNGSGTLSVCCEKLNLQGHHIRWIGIEVEQRWCDVANARLKALRELR